MASSNDEAGEDGEIQIVLEEIEVPTMEPTLQSPNKTPWLSEGTERFIKLAKGYGGRMCNACHYEFPNRGKLLEHVSQHKASYMCASRADTFWSSLIRNHKTSHGGDEYQIIYAVDAKIFGMCRENFKCPLKRLDREPSFNDLREKQRSHTKSVEKLPTPLALPPTSSSIRAMIKPIAKPKEMRTEDL